MLLWSLWCICLFELVFSFSSNIYQLVEMLHHIMILFLVIWGTSKLFQNLLHQFTFPLIVYCCSVAQSCLILCNPVDNSTPNFLSFTISQSLLRHISIESMMPSKLPILHCFFLLLPSIFPSIRVFSDESSLHITWPKYWNFSFSISPSSEYSGLISFRTDWFDLLAVHGTLKSQFYPAPDFERIISLTLSLLYGPILTSMHDYWKSHSFDYMNLCQQGNVSAF